MHWEYRRSLPFNHIIIDDFFKPDIVDEMVKEFPNYNDDVWNAHWNNQIENKKGLNIWDRFPPSLYRAFDYLLSPSWTLMLEGLVGKTGLHPDYGLNGGGLHSHTCNGYLNVHLDYSIHHKLQMKRNYNLIVYLTPGWQPEWGGGLELWSHDAENNRPKELVKTIDNRFNRAVIFDTTQNSWHGLPEKLECPDGVSRNSIALYYLTQPDANTDTRGKALFAPHKDQANDPEVLDLIKRRSDVASAEQTYNGKHKK